MAEKPPWEIQETPPWETPEVGTLEDVGKSAVSGTGTGLLSIPGMVGDLQGIMGRFDVSDKLKGLAESAFPNVTKKMEEESARTKKSGLGAALAEGSADIPGSYKLPSTQDIQSQVEKWTGPFYQPKTGAGRITHTATSVFPSALAGGEGAVVPLARAIGAGLGGEAANQIADLAPESAQPWIRGAGTAAGFMGTPRALTWNPMSAEQFAATRNLSPEMKSASTAGQWTGSPRWQAVEAYSPKGQAAPAAQEAAFTKDVLGQAGHPGPLDTLSDTITNQGNVRAGVRNTNEINPLETRNLQVRNAARTYGLQRNAANALDVQPYVEATKDMYYGPFRNTLPQAAPPTTIPGPRYQAIRQNLNPQAGQGTAMKEAFKGMKGDLDQAFLNSLTPAEAQLYQNTGQQMKHGLTINEVPLKPNQRTITPEELYPKAINKSNEPLARYSEDSARVMSGMPTPSGKAPAWFNLANTLGAAGAGYGMGGWPGAFAGGAVERAVLGHLVADPLWGAAAGTVGRAAMSKPIQAVAKNQYFRPGNAIVDPRALATINLLQSGNQQ